MSDSTKEQFFEDDVTVVGVDAHLWFDPLFDTDSDGSPDDVPLRIFELSNWQWEFFGGLRKIRHRYLTDDIAATDVGDPIPAPLSFSNDRTDAGYIRKKYDWKRQIDLGSSLANTFTLEGAIIGSCSEVRGGANPNTLTDGSGTINTAISTECCSADCEQQAGTTAHSSTATFAGSLPRVRHHFRTRRRFRLRNKEALAYDFEVLVSTLFRDKNPRVVVTGFVDLLIET